MYKSRCASCGGVKYKQKTAVVDRFTIQMNRVGITELGLRSNRAIPNQEDKNTPWGDVTQLDRPYLPCSARTMAVWVRIPLGSRVMTDLFCVVSKCPVYVDPLGGSSSKRPYRPPKRIYCLHMLIRDRNAHKVCFSLGGEDANREFNSSRIRSRSNWYTVAKYLPTRNAPHYGLNHHHRSQRLRSGKIRVHS